MVNEKSWSEFRESGLMWFANSILHMFGWAICCEVDDGEVKRAYPARVKFRGFTEQINTDGYQKVSEYMLKNAEELFDESLE